MHWRLGRAGLAGLLVSTLALVVVPATGASAQGYPKWYGTPHHTSLGADTVARRLAAGLPAASGARPADTICKAEPSTVNTQVNCRAADGTSAQNTQSETSVAVSGSKVVVGYNDSFVCCAPLDLSGYSVSNDGGVTFTDMGAPGDPNIQSLGDPALAEHDGTFYMAGLATDASGNSLIAVFVMPKGSDKFKLLSVPVNVGPSTVNFADKPYLAVPKNGPYAGHLFLSWTFFSPVVPSPIKLSYSADGIHWRMTPVAEASACSQGSTPLPAGNLLYVSYEQTQPVFCTRGNPSPIGNEMMTTIDIASGHVLRRTVIAPIAGSGDAIVSCNGPQDLREVIETAPGHDMRTFELPSIARDPNGVLYAIWQDRKNGLGGGPSNSTNIYLSFSRDGDKTWSAPQQISGAVSATHELDRVQPWLSSDARGLHAMWYERVPGGGPDRIRTDTEDLTFATATKGPMPLGEKAISPPAGIAQTNPNQDPIISNCYAGDYNNIVSNGAVSFVVWGDDRNSSAASGQTIQPDVFLQKY